MANNQPFWANAVLEPKRAHRWLLNLKQFPDYICKRVDKPSFTIGQSEHVFFGHSFYYPGTVKWQPVSVTIVDPIQPDAAHTLFQELQNMGYKLPTDRNPDGTMGTVSKARATEIFGDEVILRQFSPIEGVDTEVEKWILKNPWIKDVKFGGLDYASEAIVEITLTIVYDFGKLSKPSGT